jgi:hypothetical protein
MNPVEMLPQETDVIKTIDFRSINDSNSPTHSLFSPTGHCTSMTTTCRALDPWSWQERPGLRNRTSSLWGGEWILSSLQVEIKHVQ